MTNTSNSYEALDQLESEVKKVKKFVKEKKYVKAFELAFGVTLVFHQEDFWVSSHADTDVPERFQVHLTALRSAWRALLKLSDRELGIADGDTDMRGAAEDLILQFKKTFKESPSELKLREQWQEEKRELAG
ncbi:hypothetical protein HDU93_002180 [Gonapodya sp. JEL0774]|nr:hypothetical protein HDU93_002180 [Gonapodya sp. JEL0774]